MPHQELAKLLIRFVLLWQSPSRLWLHKELPLTPESVAGNARSARCR